MGWWQGRLLRDRIRALHPVWQERALRTASGGSPARAARLRDWLRLYTSKTLALLPERVRQELDGLAEATGLGAEELLLTDVLRDALRFHEGPPQLLGGDLGASGDGAALDWSPSGPDAVTLEAERVLVERRPEGGSPTLVLAWPGSLGGLAGFGARGVALASSEVPGPEQRHSLKGVPFGVSLRLALEEAPDARDAVERLSRTTSHRVVAVEPGARVALAARVDAVEAAVEEGAPPALTGGPVRVEREPRGLVLRAWDAGPVALPGTP
jgi:hypothetical protein